MIDFPNSPAVGDEFTSGGSTWKWDGTTWVAAGGGSAPPPAADLWVDVTGDTMTGPLIGTDATFSRMYWGPAGSQGSLLNGNIVLDHPIGTENVINGQHGGVARWSLQLGDAVGDALFHRSDAAGTFVDTPIRISQADGTVAVPNGIRYSLAGAPIGFDFLSTGLRAYLAVRVGTADVGVGILSDPAALAGSQSLINMVLNGGAGTVQAYTTAAQFDWVINWNLTAQTVGTSKAAPDDALLRVESIPVKEIDYEGGGQGHHATFAILPDDIEAILPEARAGDIVNDKPLVAMLIAAVQQLSARVVALEGAPARDVTINAVNPRARPRR